MRKKFISMVLCLMMFLSFSTVTFANENVTVKLNGKTLEFDVQPQLIGGRTMVPLRVIFESLGAVVEWDGSSSTVTAYNEFYIVKATIGSNTMYVNGEGKWIDVPPMEVNSRTLVPARFVAEAFNCDVQWDPNTSTVYITSNENDYSQIEKSTETTNQGSYTASTSTYDKLKNIIITNGEKDTEKKCYDYKQYDYSDTAVYLISFSYHYDDNRIVLSIASSMEGNISVFSTVINPDEERKYALFALTLNDYPEINISGEFPNQNSNFHISEYKNLNDTKLRKSATKLLYSHITLLDIYLKRDTGISFSDFGMYYDDLSSI